MDNMKKSLCLFTCLFAAFSLFAQEAATEEIPVPVETPAVTETVESDNPNLIPMEKTIPAFKSDNAYIVDIWGENLKFRDYIKLYYSGFEPTEFSVYWLNPDMNKWCLISKVPFQRNKQVATIYTSVKTVKKASYYAIVPSRDSNFEFTCEVKNHDLNVVIVDKNAKMPEPVTPAATSEESKKERAHTAHTPHTNNLPSIELKDAEVFSIQGLGANDFVRFVNKSSYNNIRFDFFVLKGRRQPKWHLFSVAELNGYNDHDTIHSGIDIEDIDYIAIKPLNKGDFSYNVYVKHHDLYIEVLDLDEDEALDF